MQVMRRVIPKPIAHKTALVGWGRTNTAYTILCKILTTTKVINNKWTNQDGGFVYKYK